MATAEVPRMTFAEALRKARTKRGMTQRALARSLKISPSVISLWESGRRVPDVEMASSIAQALSMSVQELVSFDPVVPAGKFICMPCNTPMRLRGPDQFECPACEYQYDANRLRGLLETELSRAAELLGPETTVQSLAVDVKKVYWNGKITGIEYSKELEKQMALALEQEKMLVHLGFKNPTRTARLLAQIAGIMERNPQGLAMFERLLPIIKSVLSVPQQTSL